MSSSEEEEEEEVDNFRSCRIPRGTCTLVVVCSSRGVGMMVMLVPVMLVDDAGPWAQKGVVVAAAAAPRWPFRRNPARSKDNPRIIFCQIGIGTLLGKHVIAYGTVAADAVCCFCLFVIRLHCRVYLEF